jgi:hypothetical protein
VGDYNGGSMLHSQYNEAMVAKQDIMGNGTRTVNGFGFIGVRVRER